MNNSKGGRLNYFLNFTIKRVIFLEHKCGLKLVSIGGEFPGEFNAALRIGLLLVLEELQSVRVIRWLMPYCAQKKS